jgi:hypothetical protein
MFFPSSCSIYRGCWRIRQRYAWLPLVEDTSACPQVALVFIPLKMRGRLNHNSWAMRLGNAELWPAFLVLCPDACSGFRIIVKGLAHTLTAGTPIFVWTQHVHRTEFIMLSTIAAQLILLIPLTYIFSTDVWIIVLAYRSITPSHLACTYCQDRDSGIGPLRYPQT